MVSSDQVIEVCGIVGGIVEGGGSDVNRAAGSGGRMDRGTGDLAEGAVHVYRKRMAQDRQGVAKEAWPRYSALFPLMAALLSSCAAPSERTPLFLYD